MTRRARAHTHTHTHTHNVIGNLTLSWELTVLCGTNGFISSEIRKRNVRLSHRVARVDVINAPIRASKLSAQIEKYAKAQRFHWGAAP